MDPSENEFSLAAWRQQQGLSQAELAFRLKMSDRSVTRWESGKGQPGSYARQRLKKLTGATPEQLRLAPPNAPARVTPQRPPASDRDTAADTTTAPAVDAPPRQEGMQRSLLLLLVCASSLLLVCAVLLLLILAHTWR
jgi:transcriptional regulator with XRE-family HTH domain